MKGGDDYCPRHLTNEEQKPRESTSLSRGHGAGDGGAWVPTLVDHQPAPVLRADNARFLNFRESAVQTWHRRGWPQVPVCPGPAPCPGTAVNGASSRHRPGSGLGDESCRHSTDPSSHGDWSLRRWASGAGPAGFKEHVRKPWNWVTCIWVLVLRPFYSVTLGGKSLQAQLSAQGWLFLSSSFAALFPRFPGMPKYGQAHILPMASARIHINYRLSSNSLLKCQRRDAFMTTLFKIANDSPAKNISPSLPISIFKNPDTFWLISVTYLSCLYSLCPNRISIPEGQDVCLFLFKLLYPWDHQQHVM